MARFGRRMGWLQAGFWIVNRAQTAWMSLSPSERRRLRELLRMSGGRWASLSAAERRELRGLVSKALRRR